MSIRKIDSRLHVTGQLLPEQMKQVAELGYKTIICMRPDREGPGQPDFAAIEKAAVSCGLTIHHIPVVPGRVNLDQAQQLKAVLNQEAGPVLAFCASGQRCAALYNLTDLA